MCLAVRWPTEFNTMRQIALKLMVWLFAITVCPCCAWAQQDPCPSGPNVSNAETRDCYLKAQLRMNKTADDLAAQIATNLRKTSPKEKEIDGPVIIQCLEDAAKKLDQSQVAWRTYRDQHCDAVRFSWTTGSGAGTTMEECLYTTALSRVRQLRIDFPAFASSSAR
jgi:uncharacterized protein YecT (DUF1311 family)